MQSREIMIQKCQKEISINLATKRMRFYVENST